MTDTSDKAGPVDDSNQESSTPTQSKVFGDLERLIQLRLTQDFMTLEVYVLSGSSRYPMNLRVESVTQRAAALGVTARIDEGVVRHMLASNREKQWLTIAKGTQAVPPVNGSIEVLVPSVPPLGKDRFRARTFVIRGDTLALITRAKDGLPGINLKGRALPATAARQPAIPGGQNTALVQEGETRKVVADCDGLAYFDRMQFGVYPMQPVESSALRYGAKFEATESIMVRENVPSGATIVSSGDIYIGGDVDDSTIISTGGSITVLGCVTGHYQHHCEVRAKGDIMVASALHVNIISEQDVYIQTQARNALISAARNLILLTRLRNALYDVDLRVEGAVMPLDTANAEPDVTPSERMAFDVECDLHGQIGMLEGMTVVFNQCMVHELSVAVARLSFLDSPPLPGNRAVYLKLNVPGSPVVQILGRTIAPSRDGRTVVGFRQMSHQDEAAITTFCLAVGRKRIAKVDESEESEQLI